MRILWVKSDKLLPVHNGGNIRSYHLARWLSAHHDLTFCSYYAGYPDQAYKRQLESALPGAITFAAGKLNATPLRRTLDYVLHLPLPAPYAVSRFASAAVRSGLQSWFQQRRFDVAVCDFLDAAVNFPHHLAIPSVLFQHNVESEIWRRHAATEGNPVKRLIYELEFRKMRRYEQRTVRRFDHVIAVSEHDRRLMSDWVDESRITVVPTGVDLQQFHPSASTPEKPLVVFVGAMDWEPNVDAVEYFYGEIWPSISKEIPAARFRIVGRNPGRRVQKLASPSIEVTGLVSSVQEHLAEAAVVVVPLRIGGGTRLKIYEAMAMGKAVVSTSVGAEGLDVHDGGDIVLSDQADGFAAAVVRFLQNTELRRGYERAAAQLAGQHDWAAISQRFARVLETIAGMTSSLEDRERIIAAETAMSFGAGPEGEAH